MLFGFAVNISLLTIKIAVNLTGFTFPAFYSKCVTVCFLIIYHFMYQCFMTCLNSPFNPQMKFITILEHTVLVLFPSSFLAFLFCPNPNYPSNTSQDDWLLRLCFFNGIIPLPFMVENVTR
jgi:hypothetical protein